MEYHLQSLDTLKRDGYIEQKQLLKSKIFHELTLELLSLSRGSLFQITGQSNKRVKLPTCFPPTKNAIRIRKEWPAVG